MVPAEDSAFRIPGRRFNFSADSLASFAEDPRLEQGSRELSQKKEKLMIHKKSGLLPLFSFGK